MARAVDRIQDFIRDQSNIPPIERQVMIERLEGLPTQVELDCAKAVVELEEAALLDKSTRPSRDPGVGRAWVWMARRTPPRWEIRGLGAVVE